MIKNLTGIINKNTMLISGIFIAILSSYNSPFLFLLNYDKLNFFKIFVLYQHIVPLIVFSFLLLYVYKLNFFCNFFSKEHLILKFLIFLNIILIFGILLNKLVYFYSINEVTSQISNKTLIDWKSTYTRFVFVLNNLNIIFLSFVALQKKSLEFLLTVMIGVLFLVALYYLFTVFKDYWSEDRVMFFYESKILRLGSSTLNFVNPRSSGLSRTLLIVSNFIFIYFLFYKSKNISNNNFLNFSIISIIIFINFNIFHLQSRVSIYFIFLQFLCVVFFFLYSKRYKIKNLLIILILFLILPFLLSKIVINYKISVMQNKIISTNQTTQKIPGLVDLKQHGIVTKGRYFEKTTSGRTRIWKTVLNTIDEMPFFGYGVLGDRFKYAFSVSNIFLYFFISGGILGLLGIILFNIYIVKLLFISMFLKKIINISEPFVLISFSYITFFMFRSLVENSYGQFSIDLMIFVPSLLIFENHLRKYKIIS